MEDKNLDDKFMTQQINKKQLQKQYKNITKTCIQNGHLLPYIIKNTKIPQKYKLTKQEKQKYYNQTNNQTREKLYNMIQKQEQQTKNKTTQEKQKYYQQQLQKFIQTYPQYKNIIQKQTPQKNK